MSLPPPSNFVDSIFAAAERYLQAALAPIAPELLEAHDSYVVLEITALVSLDARWQLGYLALDAFGTQLSDLFGTMQLSAPSAMPPSIFLRLRAAVPELAADELIPRLRDAVAELIRGLVEDDVDVSVHRPPAAGDA